MDFFMSNVKHVETGFWNSVEGAGEAIHEAACATADLVASQGMSDARDGAEAFLGAVQAGAEGSAAATAEGFEKLVEITPAVISGTANSSGPMGEQVGHAAAGTAAATTKGFEKLVEITPAVISGIADSSRAMGGQVGHAVAGTAAATTKGFEKLVEITPAVVSGIIDSSRAIGGQIGHAAAGTAAATAEGFEKLVNITSAVISGIVDSSRAIGGHNPVVITVLLAYGVIDVPLRASVGTSGLVAGGIVALLGGLYGPVAAPFDGGAALGVAMNIARLALGLTNQAVKVARVVGAVHPEYSEINGTPKASTGRYLILVGGAAALLAGFCGPADAASCGGAALGEAFWAYLLQFALDHALSLAFEELQRTGAGERALD